CEQLENRQARIFYVIQRQPIKDDYNRSSGHRGLCRRRVGRPEENEQYTTKPDSSSMDTHTPTHPHSDDRHYPTSISRAWRMPLSVTAAPPSIRASSSTRCSGLSGETVAIVLPSISVFSM